MKRTLYSFTICLLIIFCIGCKNKTSQSMVDIEDSNKTVIDKAIEKFDEINGPQSHKEYDISVRETADEWAVDFDGKIKLPGNHSLVTIDKHTGEIEYFHGE